MHRQIMKGNGKDIDDFIKVLYVDDEPILLDLAKEFLEIDGGLIIETSTSAIEVLEDDDIDRYDVILSDYRMPKIDGIEFLKMLRDREIDIPFIIFTGQGREDVAIEALNSGADFYIQKGGDPIAQFKELRHAIFQLAHHSMAEKALHEREEILSLITDNMRDIIVRINDKQNIDFVSPSIAVTGFSPEEIIGHNVFDFVHPNDVHRLINESSDGAIHREGITLEYQQLNKDGTYTWSEAKGKCLYDKYGNQTMAVFSIRDVEDRKQFEQELTIRSQRSQNIFRHSNLIIISLDREGRLLWMNDFAQQFFGFAEEELVGKSVMETIVPETEDVTGRDLNKVIDNIVLKTDNIEANINQNVKKNGERVWVAWTNSIMQTNDDRGSILCTGIDITEKYYSVSIMEESLSFLQSILDSIPIAILATSNDGTVQAYNYQFLDMWDLHDKYRGMPWSELSNDIQMQLEEPEDIFSKCRALGKEEMLMTTTVDDRRIGVAVKVHHLKGIPIGKIWNFVDHTETIRAQEAIALKEIKFRGVFESNAIGIGLIDEQGYILESNEALIRIFGYEMDEVIGKRLSELLSPDEEENNFFKQFGKQEWDAFSIDCKTFTKDEDPIWTRVTGSIIYRDSNRPLLGVCFIQNITDQIEIMECLRRSEGYYRDLAKNIPNSVVMIYDCEPKYVLVEGRGLGELGLDKAAIEGKKVSEVFKTGPFSIRGGAYKRVLHGETVVDTAEYMSRAYRIFNMPLITDDCEIYGGIIMGYDITDLKRTENELLRLNRSLKILTAGSHANTQASNENELYEIVCRELALVSEYQAVCIILAESNERFHVAAISSDNEINIPSYSALGDILSEVSRTGYPVWDNIFEEYHLEDDENTKGMVRSYASFPIHRHGQIIGAMMIFDSKESSFSSEEIDLLAEVAEDISMGVNTFRDHADSVRAQKILSHRGNQMRRLNTSTREVSSSLDEEDAMRKLMRATREVLGCERVMIGRVIDGRLAFYEMDYLGKVDDIFLELDFNGDALGRAMIEKKPYTSAGNGDYHNLAVVPIIGKDSSLIGALWAQDRPGENFKPWDLRLMESLADSAVAALDNVKTIRQLKIRENELEQANNKLELIGHITRHDLSNHLTTLNGFLELEQMEGHSSKYLDKATKSANIIAKHIKFARDYSEIGKRAPEWISLKEAIHRGSSMIDLDDITFDIESDDVELYVDRMVEKVFYNLLDNSIRHGKARVVKISSEEGEAGYVITYADDGVGISDDIKESIFDLTSSHHGLYLSREILSLTGIKIAEQGREGEGVKFQITVPIGAYRRTREAAQA